MRAATIILYGQKNICKNKKIHKVNKYTRKVDSLIKSINKTQKYDATTYYNRKKNVRENIIIIRRHSTALKILTKVHNKKLAIQN